MLLYYERDINLLPLDTPPELQIKIAETLKVLDEHHGSDRATNDYGGCVIYVPKGEEYTEQLEQFHIDVEATVEFATSIQTSQGEEYIYALFQISSDYGVSIIMHKDDTPNNIIQEIQTLN